MHFAPSFSYGAGEQNRTADLFITNEVHYLCATPACLMTHSVLYQITRHLSSFFRKQDIGAVAFSADRSKATKCICKEYKVPYYNYLLKSAIKIADFFLSIAFELSAKLTLDVPVYTVRHGEMRINPHFTSFREFCI